MLAASIDTRLWSSCNIPVITLLSSGNLFFPNPVPWFVGFVAPFHIFNKEYWSVLCGSQYQTWLLGRFRLKCSKPFAGLYFSQYSKSPRLSQVSGLKSQVVPGKSQVLPGKSHVSGLKSQVFPGNLGLPGILPVPCPRWSQEIPGHSRRLLQSRKFPGYPRSWHVPIPS